MSDSDTGRYTDEQIEAFEAEARAATGPIAYMARNGVAANLLMLAIIALGIVAGRSIVQEVFPEFSLDAIQTTVVYPGATPEEVEESIVQKIEEAIEAVEGIKEIRGTAAEGRGVVTAELKLGTDVSQALDDIKSEVDQITTFPVQAEEPAVRELTNRQSVIRIALYGDASERTLKELAYRAEDELAQLDVVSFVQAASIRDYEISIEVSQAALRAYGLSLPQIARTVAASSLDLPAGTIDTRDQQVRVRTLGQNYTQQDFEDIVLVSRPNGTVLRLGQVATVRDAFTDADLITRYNGQPAAFVEVFRTSDERVLEIAEAVNAYLETELRPALPAGVEIEVWDDNSDVLQDRLSLLLKNAGIGLALVLLALTMFLNLRLAFWTAIGIGVSFVGTLFIMYLLGVSINLLSLFGFILAIGIVVDDAIVSGENIFAEREKGLSGMAAAIRGARRIAVPVTFAVLTTVAAFSPLLFVPGTLGKILGAIPIVVISVLGLSLVESLFVLPHHLSNLPAPGEASKNPVSRFFERLRTGTDRQLKRFVNGPLDRALQFSTDAPAVVIAAAIAVLIVAFSLIPAGILRVQFFPAVEGDVVIASLEMPVGTTIEETEAVALRIEEAGRRVAARLEQERDEDAAPLFEALYTTVGQGPVDGGPGGATGGQPQANLAAVNLRLLTAERREISAVRFEQFWRDEVGPLPEARSFTISSNLISVGEPVSVELSHPEAATLDEITAQVQGELARFSGVFDIQSDADAGLQEVQVRLKPAARTLGLTLQDVAGQVRAAFFGDEALRVQRGQEDVRVYVRLPENERDAIADVEQYRIQVPTQNGLPGGQVPLREVAEASFGTAPSAINRKDGRRVVTVTADVDAAVVTGQEVTAQLRSEILPAVQRDYPQMVFEFGGEQQEQAESGAALGRGFGLALLVIFALIAIPFRSYIQPLVIMAAIPFGIIGAFIGHLFLGISVGILSLFGIIGLSGVVVNDSLVMIDFINERRRNGAAMREAIIEGAKERFRPILLTTVTTFLGVAPITFEQSLQAQFLIPMAASLGFGIVFATGVLMLLVPALAMVEYNTEKGFKTRILGRDEEEVEVVHSAFGEDSHGGNGANEVAEREPA
ncbi:MAG: efflux RND transporter permease subunit [Bacteroidota bacterium]